MRLGSDGLAGVIGLCVSALLTWQSFGLPSLPMVPVGPGFYPRIVLAVLALASIALIVESVFANRSRQAGAGTASRGGAEPRDAHARAGYGRVALGFVVVTAYVFALPYLGFRIATVLFVAAMLAAIERPHTPAQWATAVAIALATSAVTWLAFELYLAVLLPRGLWTGW